MKTWRQGVEVEFRTAGGAVLRARCLKYPLLRVLTDPPTNAFVRREALADLVRVGEAPLTPEERRAGEGWTYLSEAAGIAGTPPPGVDRALGSLSALVPPPAAPTRAASFDAAADLYDRTRPGYAPELWAALAEAVPPRPGLRLLEVGAGTGQATVELLTRWGPDLVCLEPGGNLARRLREKTGATVVEQAFEDYRPEGLFDLLVSATAWHWPPADRKYALARQALAAGGHLAVFWNSYSVADPAFAASLQGLYRRHGLAASTGEPDQELLRRKSAARRAEVEAAEGLGLVTARQGGQVLDWPVARFLDLLRTFSDHAAAPPDLLGAFLADVAALAGPSVALAVSWDLLVARRES